MHKPNHIQLKKTGFYSKNDLAFLIKSYVPKGGYEENHLGTASGQHKVQTLSFLRQGFKVISCIGELRLLHGFKGQIVLGGATSQHSVLVLDVV